MKRLLLAILPIIVFIASCEKAEKSVSLPPRGTSTAATVNMGPDLLDQIFFDLETNKVVHTSLINSWDLAFEASPNGYHVFINGVKLSVYNTHSTDFNQFGQYDADKIDYEAWQDDASCNIADSTAIGEWKTASGATKNELYILKVDSASLNPIYYKLMLANVTPTEYKFVWGTMNSSQTYTITLPKEDDFNYVYYSFIDGPVNPEPPKSTWDIVFTRYIHIYHNLAIPIHYPVSGALLNPHNTLGSLIDSNSDYSKIDQSILNTIKLSNFRDAIGFGWKDYNDKTGKYIVNKQKVYILHTQEDYYWKLRFLDYHDAQGVRGSPSFEFERLQ